MIDYLTLRIPWEELGDSLSAHLQRRSRKLLCINPDGEVEYSVWMRESLRERQMRGPAIQCGTREFVIWGSPARCHATHNLFGKPDVVDCATDMIEFVCEDLDVELPRQLDRWKCTRIDVTRNMWCYSALAASEIMRELRDVSTGRLKVLSQYETVYWNRGSRLFSGKAYQKGPELQERQKKREARIDKPLLDASMSVIRAELSIGAQWLRERAHKEWYHYGANELAKMNREYFSKLWGRVTVKVEDKMYDALVAVAKTKGDAARALGVWYSIKSVGVEQTSAMYGRRTWYRYRKLLMDAGVSATDMQQGEIVPIRMPIEVEEVADVAHLLALAAA